MGLNFGTEGGSIIGSDYQKGSFGYEGLKGGLSVNLQIRIVFSSLEKEMFHLCFGVIMLKNRGMILDLIKRNINRKCFLCL